MPPEVETHHEPHRSGHRWVDWSVTGCALFVSFCSLFLSIHHGHTMERLVQANSLPFLQFGSSNVVPRADGSFANVILLEVENVGAGPARVEWFRTTFGGEPVLGWSQTLDTLQRHVVASGKLSAAVPLGAVISGDFGGAAFLKGGDKRQALRWASTEANADFWKIVDARISDANGVLMRACYCSIFDQCWIASSRSFKPQSVDSCSKED